MLSVGNTLAGSGASLSLDARVAVGAGVFVVSQPDTSAAVAETPAITVPDQKLPAYNGFEFTYRSDFGKIILLEQNVETGQEVTQVPTEYHLQQYAASQRAQRVQQQQKLYHAQAASGEPQQKTTKTVVVAKTTGAGAPSGGTAAPAASQPAAPAVAASTVAAATAAHVDIKV